jgi:hypothetical protein
LLSPAELAELARPPGSPREPLAERAEAGLVTKVLAVLLQQPPGSKYRFWLSSCVEAFLRGADPLHQAFVARSGLLEHLLREVPTGISKRLACYVKSHRHGSKLRRDGGVTRKPGAPDLRPGPRRTVRAPDELRPPRRV